MPPFCPFILPFHPIHRKKLRAVGEEGNRGRDDWMASLTRWICYINGLVHNVYEWLFKQNTDILRLIHVIRYINSFFIFIAALYFVLYIFHKLFISSLIYTYFSTFDDYNFAKNYIANFYFAAMNACKTAMNIY